MSLFRFGDRASVLDDRSRHFLTTVAWLGGYVTLEQAQLLGIRNSVPRVHVQLKDLESWGFIKRVGVYPSIYQSRKSPHLCLAGWRIRWFDPITQASELPDHF